jgi:hypothetical protein
MRQRGRTGARPGYVLYIVLVVVVVLTLVTYQYADAMSSEASAAVRAHELEQAKANAVSGIHYVAELLTNPAYAGVNLDDDPTQFGGLPVGSANPATEPTDPRWQGDANLRRGGGRFSLINLSDTSGTGVTRRYGIEDESRKLNVNALILLDPVGNALYGALLELPNMTEEIADAIVDWLDADNSIRPNGAESDYYTGGQQPYRCKNGPISSLEELLLVRGVTPVLLFGTDRNRNGVQDGNEEGSDRGWSEYLTCYGRELNVDTAGVARINLNTDDLVTLSTQLEPLVGREAADYILYYRLSGTGEAFQAELPAGRQPAPVAALRDLVQNALDSGTAIPRRKLTSVFTVLNTQIRLPAVQMQGPGGQPQMVTPVVACPLNDKTALSTCAQVMVDRLTASEDYEMVPRINVNTAPVQVLNTLKGVVPYTPDPNDPDKPPPDNILVQEDIDAILNNRPAAGTDPTAAWLVTAAGLSPAKFKSIEKYVCGRSGAFRVRSVGYFANPGGPQASVEAVVEVVAEDADGSGPIAKPRIAYFRDTTDLGQVFADLPR